jgi:hypothetical protein
MKPATKKLILRKEAIRILTRRALELAIGGAASREAVAIAGESTRVCPAPDAATIPRG